MGNGIVGFSRIMSEHAGKGGGYAQRTGSLQRHRAVFQDEAAAGSFAGSFGTYHGMLRQQLAQPLRKFCGSDFAADFLAEALLTWTMARKSFDEIYGMMEKLF